MAILEAKNVYYKYGKQSDIPEVLTDISFSFECGKVYALSGRSGSGKSTLLSLLAGLDEPCSGEIFFDGVSLSTMDKSAYRREKVSVIYQNFALFPLLTVIENISYPMNLCGLEKQKVLEKARELAGRVGLGEALWNRFPGQISGGEQQRVAIARALAMDRRVILADEPTGNLDSDNSDNILNLLLSLSHDEKCCIIVATHDPDVMERADVVAKMDKGALKIL